MSWQVQISGHRDDQDDNAKEIEAKIVTAVKAAVKSLDEAGVSWAEVRVYPLANKVVYNKYDPTAGS